MNKILNIEAIQGPRVYHVREIAEGYELWIALIPGYELVVNDGRRRGLRSVAQVLAIEDPDVFFEYRGNRFPNRIDQVIENEAIQTPNGDHLWIVGAREPLSLGTAIGSTRWELPR